MDVTPITGVEELEDHVRQLIDDPSIPLNAKLFDEVGLQLTEANISPLIPRLLPNLTQALLVYEKDPTILCSLAIKLLQPVTFTQCLQLASEEALSQALRSPAPAANILAITVIEKAARSPSDTSILSIMKGVIEDFLRTWLCSPDVGVGKKATEALGDLLQVDSDRKNFTGIKERMENLHISTPLNLNSSQPPGQGLLWRRIFHDREIYEMILSLCSFETVGNGPGQIDERQKTLAQGRLLDLIPRLAILDFQEISSSHFPDISVVPNRHTAEYGLLGFAALDMVTDREDLLMRVTLLNFYAEFLNVMSQTELTKPTIDHLGRLMKEIIASDSATRRSLESMAAAPDSSPELVELCDKIDLKQ
ncbi:hypothetical protein F5884DRAFT_482497 [Xylogone sp. PMI_703]|nr:hypothetical protein F5884DRAFT_482497 [Xylogone sp. PMI_703]